MLTRVDVLLLGDWGLEGGITDRQRRDLLEVLDYRYASRLTIVTSQLPVESWHQHIGDPTLADVILDRLVHNAHRNCLGWAFDASKKRDITNRKRRSAIDEY